jgi:hypothetical protein
MINTNDKNAERKTGIIDNTILFYVYYPQSSIGSDASIIEKQMEIAVLSNLKMINIGLYNISENDSKVTPIINNIIKNAKDRLASRYKMEEKHIKELSVNLIYFTDNNFTTTLEVLLYTTYFFPEKQEDKKNIKGKYSFVFLKDGYDNKQQTTIKNEDRIIQTIKNNLNPNIIFTKISFNENVQKMSSTYIRNIAITSNYDKFDNMMMKLGYNKKNSDEILNVIRNSSNVMTVGDIFKKTTSMISDLGSNLTSKFSDMVNNKDNSINNINTNANNENNANNANNLNLNGRVSYAINGGYKKRKTRKQSKTIKQTKNRKQSKKRKTSKYF